MLSLLSFSTTSYGSITKSALSSVSVNESKSFKSIGGRSSETLTKYELMAR